MIRASRTTTQKKPCNSKVAPSATWLTGAGPYLDNLLYELVNDPGVQAEFRDSLGLCERHAYLMLEQGLTSGWEWWTWRSWLWPRSLGRT